MPNVNERLARFEKAVFSEVENKACEILSEVDVYKEEKLAGVQDRELQQAYQKIQQKIDEIRSGFAKSVTREKLAAKQQLLLRRQQLAEELFAEAAERVRAFAKTADYDRFLQAALERNREYLTSGAKILARSADIERVQKLAGGIPVEEASFIQLGGLVIVQDAERVYLDETLETRMETAKEQFYASGKADLK